MDKHNELEEEWEKIEKNIKRKILQIENGMLFVPRAFVATVVKHYREKMDEGVRRKAVNDKIYHFTSEKSANLIMQSGHIRAGNTRIGSYGKVAVNAFLGLPEIDDLVKNISGDLKDNIGGNAFLDSSVVLDAIEIAPEYDETRGWKTRPLADSAIIIDGAYLLPMERARHVKVGLDLERDEEGKPKFDYERETYKIVSRVLTEKDFDKDGNYVPPEDFFKIVTERSEELGFKMREKSGGNLLRGNRLNHVLVGAQFESDVYKRQIKQKLLDILKGNFKKRKLLPTREEIVQNQLENSSFNTINPSNRVQKVTKYAGKIMVEEGIQQEPVSRLLSEINGSEVGEFLQKKIKSMDLSKIPTSGLHGLKHNNRVAMLALRIAQKQGLLENDTDGKIKDMIITASYYHDLGRVVGGIAFDLGPHAKRSVKKLNNMNLTYLNGQNYTEEDMNILKLLIEGHETKKDEEFDKLSQKYNIQDDKLSQVNQLFKIIKDADALDRVRLDKWSDKIPLPFVRGSVDLNFNYLRSGEAKSLIFASYELESLSRTVPPKEFSELLKYGTEDKMKESKGREAFLKGLEVSQDVKRKISEVTQNVNIKIKTFSKKHFPRMYKKGKKKMKEIWEALKDESGYIKLGGIDR